MTYLNDFTTQMSRSPVAETLNNLWSKVKEERWDVASTGCVANITPIFGYLWLMVAAHQREDMLVTKLPSKGRSCGTVDILEAGGLSFPTIPQSIVKQCQEQKGVICQPSEDLAPVDKVFMEVRRSNNCINNISFVYASILAKRIAIGCTHCIVDVKLGRDTKMLAPWMTDKQIKMVTTNCVEDGKQKLVIDGKEWLELYQELLVRTGAAASTKLKIQQSQWIEQDSEGELSGLVKVRWLLTNSSMPQCRAIGRQLILRQIDRMISGADDLLKGDNEYKKLYFEVLPKICQVESPDWDSLKKQWEKFKTRLPQLNNLTVEKYLAEESYNCLETSYGENLADLKIISFGIYPYQLVQTGVGEKVAIKQMDAYLLDQLFEWLCGEENYDPEVGIWLHKLPGEQVELPSDQAKERIISILYRPSRCSESEVIARARQFISEIKLR